MCASLPILFGLTVTVNLRHGISFNADLTIQYSAVSFLLFLSYRDAFRYTPERKSAISPFRP
jgi:hypothetical protein